MGIASGTGLDGEQIIGWDGKNVEGSGRAAPIQNHSLGLLVAFLPRSMKSAGKLNGEGRVEMP